MMCLNFFFIFIFVILLLIYKYFKKCYKYWDQRNVKVISQPVLPIGNLGKFVIGISTSAEIFFNLYKKCTEPFGGVFLLHLPALLVKDPKLVKHILVKDFNHFHDRGVDADTKKEPIMEHLFMLEGKRWKQLRSKLSPTFTSGKLKMMFPTIVNCGIELQKSLQSKADKNMEIELRECVARYTTDIISSVAFGIQTNSVHNPDSEFRYFGKRVLETGFFQSIIDGLFFVAPGLLKLLGFRLLDQKSTDFFTNALKETVEYREKNNIIGKDFLQLLIELKNKGRVEDADELDDEQNNKTDDVNDFLTFNQLTAQSFVFFVAGFETSSSTMNFCFYELALHPEIQKKVQKEIDQVLARYNGQISYESISEMNYLDNVVSETLRKYPILEFLNRKCTKEYKVPNSELTIEEGVQIIISVRGLHHDPNHFPNPDKFDPDRFLPENKKWDPYCYLPFGEGPRICIGARMGKIQTKVGLISILNKFDVNVCEKTQIPIKFSKRRFLLAPETELIFKISNR